MTAHAPTRPARAWALSGTVLVATGVLGVLGLHVVAVEVDPLRRTLSQYALGPWKRLFDAGVLAVALSQSGRTGEIAQTLAWAGDCGARTLAITNGPGSPLAGAAEVTFATHAGTERAVPAPKSFTAQRAALAVRAG